MDHTACLINLINYEYIDNNTSAALPDATNLILLGLADYKSNNLGSCIVSMGQLTS
jgi:hypothetical protein